VATVQTVERRVESGFARIALVPAAPPDGVRHVLILQPLGTQLPARPEPPSDKPDKPEKPEKPSRRGTRP
jgi:rod shape-determining protein MreC